MWIPKYRQAVVHSFGWRWHGRPAPWPWVSPRLRPLTLSPPPELRQRHHPHSSDQLRRKIIRILNPPNSRGLECKPVLMRSLLNVAMFGMTIQRRSPHPFARIRASRRSNGPHSLHLGRHHRRSLPPPRCRQPHRPHLPRPTPPQRHRRAKL